MGNSDSVYIALIALVIWGYVLYRIIASASQSIKIERQMRIQTKLLSLIAKQYGVPIDAIERVLNEP